MSGKQEKSRQQGQGTGQEHNPGSEPGMVFDIGQKRSYQQPAKIRKKRAQSYSQSDKGFAACHHVNENRNNGSCVEKSGSSREERTFQYQ